LADAPNPSFISLVDAGAFRRWRGPGTAEVPLGVPSTTSLHNLFAVAPGTLARPTPLSTPEVLPRRRRSELGLCLVGIVLIAFAAILLSISNSNALPRDFIFLIVVLLAITALIQVVNRRLAPGADPVIVPIALVLNGIGYIFIERQVPADASRQFAWTIVGLLVYIAVLVGVRRSRDLERYRYLLVLVAFVLLVLPVVPKIGQSINGARLWVGVGPIAFQPVEIAKLLLVIFFASYFIEKRELLTVPTRRVGNRLLPDVRAFGPIAVAGVFSLLIILAEHDIGFSLILFLVFLSLLWVTTGRWTHLAIGLVLFALGTFLASHLLGQVNERMEIWLNPWKYASGIGFQPVQGELAFGRGGLYGTGINLGLAGNPLILPVSESDYIFAVIGEELGLFGTVAIAIGYLILIGAGIRASLRARSEFAKLCALGLTATIGLQSFIIMAGVVRLLPLTGVTLPFISYGGSSLVANYALIALLMRISDEGNRPYAEVMPIAWRTSLATVMGGGGRWRSASATPSEGRHSRRTAPVGPDKTSSAR
jgi:cell division protein FtsW (lipid II flippase)